MTRVAQRCLAAWCVFVCCVGVAVAAQSNLPLDQAARNGDVSTVRTLLQQGADPNELNKWGTNALTGACSLGADSAAHTQIVELLLSNGADVNRQVLGGTTALNEAAYWGHVATVKLLINAGAEVNAAKENGSTPLLGAASRGHADIVRALIGAGADLEARTKDGLTALHLASAGGFSDVVDILKQSGANTKVRSATGETYDDVASRTAELQQAVGQLEEQSSATPTSQRAESARQGAAGGLAWWELLLSVVVTWVIGLTPPLLTRFVLLRGPMSRGPAIAFAAVQYFCNLLLFIALGSTSRSHAALFLVAWASYLILIRPLTTRELRKQLPTVASAPKPEQSVAEGLSSTVLAPNTTEPPVAASVEQVRRAAVARQSNGERVEAAASTTAAQQGGPRWWSSKRRRVVVWAAVIGALVGAGGSLSVYSDWREGLQRERVVSARPVPSDPSLDYSAAIQELARRGELEAAAAPKRAPAAEMAILPFIGALAGIVVAMAVLWPMSYAHRGWRRVAILAGAAAFIVMVVLGSVEGDLFDSPDYWARGVIAGLLAPGATIGLVRLCGWVRAGFQAARD